MLLTQDCIAVSRELILERSVDLHNSVSSACDARQSDNPWCQTEAVCTERIEQAQELSPGVHRRVRLVSLLVSWCFKPSQPQRITSGLNTNFTLSQLVISQVIIPQSHVFLAYLYSAGTQDGNLHPAGWPILFCGPTQEPCVSHSQHKKTRERFWKKCRWMDRKGRN